MHSFTDHRYYHLKILSQLQRIIPKGKKILMFGSFDGWILSKLNPSYGVGIELEKNAYRKSCDRYPYLTFYSLPYEKYIPDETFDYIICMGTLGTSLNIMGFLKQLSNAATPQTRIIIYQHNHWWQPILNLLEKVNLKRKEEIHNWLSIDDVKNFIEASDFQITRIMKKTIVPASLGGIGDFINTIFAYVPFFDFLKLDQFLITRLLNKFDNTNPSLSICITVRNEKENIEPIVRSIPKVTQKQEIIFVEGYSNDGTQSEIRKVMKKYPRQNIQHITQTGYGQADAIRTGFKKSHGDIIILFEGDQTADGADLEYFYQTLKVNRLEFCLGTRFVYPLSTSSMPLTNKIGNMMFARFFSFFLGQSVTDVLSGLKGISKKHFMEIDKNWHFLGTSDPFGDFELLFGAAKLGLKIGEIPVRYYPRIYGITKTKPFYHGVLLAKMALKGYTYFR